MIISLFIPCGLGGLGLHLGLLSINCSNISPSRSDGAEDKTSRPSW